MTKKIITLYIILISCISVYAQDYPQWPADKPETELIQQSQSREIRLGNSVLPQEIDMQDKMRVLINDMMQKVAEKLNWPMVELSEYTNDNAFQNGGTPYNLRSPRGIDITFQFIINKDSLMAWKKYQQDFTTASMDKQQAGYNNIQSIVQSAEYKKYQDSVNHYLNLYTTYCEAHKDEGAKLYTTDKHPKYYQQKENEFINKMTAMTDESHNNSGIEQSENEGNARTRIFRNHTALQVTFKVNNYNAIAIDQTLGPINFTSVPYPITGAKFSRLYSVQKNQEHFDFDKWNNVLMILLGNFQTKPDKNGFYKAGFYLNGQGDEHTPKKIKSDKAQNISISILGDKSNVEKMAKLIDVEKLDNVIVKN